MSASSSTSTAALDEMRDLCGFINHHNAQVRLQACKMVTSLSASADNRTLIAQVPAMIPALAKQMTDVKEISREVYKALINLAESEEIYQAMLKANLISIAMECLRDSSTDLEMRELILMFLVNMSRDEKGASLLMQEGTEMEGLHVRRLLNWFTQPAPTTPPSASSASKLQPVLDPNAYCAHILTNISQIAPGRRLLMNADRGYLAQMKPQLLSPHPIRRMGTFQTFKNCFIEESHHATLLSPQLSLFPSLLAPILGPEPFLHGESEYAGIDPKVRAQMTDEKRRDPDPHLRVLVYEILLLCAKYKPSRVHLKSQAIYPILRHAHDAEKASSDPAAAELDEMLEQLIPFFILDEDDSLHPDQIESEKRRARVEQLKAINDDEAKHPGETAAARRERLAKEQEEMDKNTHYLGDELGGEVRRKAEMEKRAAAAAASAAASGSSESKPPVKASSVAPSSATVELIDETFPDIEPLGAAETLQLGDVAHNALTLDAAKAALASSASASSAAAAPKAEVVYAQAAPAEDEDDEEEEEDVPPPLADEEDRNGNGSAQGLVPAVGQPGYNPFATEPFLQSVMARPPGPPIPGLLSNGWPPLTLVANAKAVIPGVSSNAVGKNYRVSHKIGMGSFGEIYLGVDIRTNERIAIKVENRSTKYPQLMEEYQVYRAVAKGVGVPAAIWCGSNSNVHIMVMELLGDSLETLYNNCGRKFSLKTITMLAIQLLHRIEHHHNHHYLHRDIKPDNFLMGPPQSQNAHILYMVDMGLCKKYRDETNLHHIPYRENKKLIGTPRYASINTHLGIEQCRRDDLESIGYMLIYFFAGKLPWQGLKAKNKQEKYDKISASKMQISVEALCKGAPDAFRVYLQYCREMRFTQKPDYKYLRALFYDLFRNSGWKDDCIYDWMIGKDGLATQTIPAGASALAGDGIGTPAAAHTPVAAARPAAAQTPSPYGSLHNTTGAPATPTATAAQQNAYNLQQYNLMSQYTAQVQAAQAVAVQQQQQMMQAQNQAMQAAAQAQQAQQAAAQQAQQQAAAAAVRVAAAAAFQVPAARAAPAAADPVPALRARITSLEAQLETQRSLVQEWKTHWEKSQVTIAAQRKEINTLKQAAAAAEAARGATTTAAVTAAAASSAPFARAPSAAASAAAAAPPSPKADAPIPLASAASLKRRRVVAGGTNNDSAGDPSNEDGADAGAAAGGENKKARKKP